MTPTDPYALSPEPLSREPLSHEPLSPEPTCVEVLAFINWYVDCECDVTTMLVIAGHLDACCGCGEELVRLRWLKSAVRRCGGGPESRPWP